MFSTARRGRDPASDTLCRSPPRSGRESRFGGPPGPLLSPPRQRTTTSSAQGACRGDCSPTTATKRASVSTTSDRLSLGCPLEVALMRASALRSRAPSAVLGRVFTPTVRPSGGALIQGRTSRASWVRGQIDASVAQALFHAIARGGKGYPNPISLGHLLSRARGDAGWRGRHAGRSKRLLRTHRGMKPCTVSRANPH